MLLFLQPLSTCTLQTKLLFCEEQGEAAAHGKLNGARVLEAVVNACFGGDFDEAAKALRLVKILHYVEEAGEKLAEGFGAEVEAVLAEFAAEEMLGESDRRKS